MSKDNDSKMTIDDMREFSSKDIRKRKVELVEMFDDVFSVCRALVDIAKVNPTKIKASMLAQIMRLLTNGSNILKMAESLKEEIKEDIDREGGEGMTPEEREMVEYIEKMDSGEYSGTQSSNDRKDDNYKDPNTGYGFNYRRDE